VVAPTGKERRMAPKLSSVDAKTRPIRGAGRITGVGGISAKRTFWFGKFAKVKHLRPRL
jgi:hypothetical protein